VSKPLSSDELQFLARFAKLPEGYRLIQYLTAKLKDADESLRKAPVDDVMRAQGRAMAFHELLKDLQEAPERLERTTGSRPRVIDSVTPILR
jgi:hypothetical protein